jgi:hypothetical protein
MTDWQPIDEKLLLYADWSGKLDDDFDEFWKFDPDDYEECQDFEPLPAPPPLVIDCALDVRPLDLAGGEKAQEDRIGQPNSAEPR